MFNRPFFPPGRHNRLFEKGDLKYVILNLLKEKPSHGYEIIRALEETFHGFYTPSAGSVYPTLQMLDDMSYVSSSERDGKKVYTITEEGIHFLKEQKEVVDKINEQTKDWRGLHNHEGFHATIRELHNLGRLLSQRAHLLESEKWADIRDIVSRACREIENIVDKKDNHPPVK
jgi:DNA-binding PadR family transcriptional regulator